jgi:hypothetical protein
MVQVRRSFTVLRSKLRVDLIKEPVGRNPWDCWLLEETKALYEKVLGLTLGNKILASSFVIAVLETTEPGQRDSEINFFRYAPGGHP